MKPLLSSRAVFFCLATILAVEATIYFTLKGSATDRQGHLASTMERAALVMFSVVTMIARYLDRKKKGQSRDAYLVARLGGVDGVLRNANMLRNVAWGFLAATLIVPWGFAWQSPIRAKIVLTGLFGSIFVPVALYMLYASAKERRIAKEASEGSA
jgi:hypothetical protein